MRDTRNTVPTNLSFRPATTVADLMAAGSSRLARAIVSFGRVSFPFALETDAPESLAGQWEAELERLEAPGDRLVTALFLVPDAFGLVYEFGAVGRLREKLGLRRPLCDCDAHGRH